MMKRLAATILSLSAISSVQASELDNLIQTSAALAGKIDNATKLVGAAIENSYTGQVAPSGLADDVIITVAEVQAYNSALAGMSTYQPYGDVQTFLEDKASEELTLMNEAIDTFSDAVVQMSTVIEVADMAETAATPSEEAGVQTYVETNYESLAVDQDTVDTYNQSVQDIETHANNAGAYLGVSQSKEAVEFLEQGAVTNNVNVNDATAFYSASQEWVSLSWGNGNATAVYINGNNFGLDLYVTTEEVYFAGEQSQFYLTSPSNYYGEYQ